MFISIYEKLYKKTSVITKGVQIHSQKYLYKSLQ